MKKRLRQTVCSPVDQTDPPQFFSFEWWEVDIEYERRREEDLRRLGLATSVVAIIFGFTAFLSVILMVAL